jgi:hypothetical protein
MLDKETLRACTTVNLIRLANALKLTTSNMSRGQIIRLIIWRLHPNRNKDK